jgi:two-component system alkaline phosphatase synthesis response regulator PhoP
MDRKRILIVDDDDNFTRMLKRTLDRIGFYEVFTENQGSQAVAAARVCAPDLILLDVIMPDMDGGDVMAALQRDLKLRRIPVVFLTAAVSKQEGQEGGVISGGFQFLAKPVSLKGLVECIEAKLGHPNKGKLPHAAPETDTPKD